MATWSVDEKSKPGILAMRLAGVFSVEEMREFVRAHNAGVDSFGTKPYRVFVDIRELMPLSPDCAAALEAAKQYSADHKNFQGSAVLTASSVVAMQHRRTSQAGGVLDTELISDDEQECWKHLAVVKRA
jgi:hypothetical protein